MSAPDTTRFQVNFKTPGGTLINIYAQSDPDLAFQLASLNKLAGEIAATEALLTGASNVGKTPPASQQQGDTEAPNVVPFGPSCRHGAMVRKTGTNKRGPYSGWVCPSTNRQDQCPAQWDNN